MKRSLIVFTNKRIFIVPTRLNYSYRKSLAHIPYSDMQEISVRGKTLIVKCKLCGQMKKFIGISGKEAKKIKALAKTVKPDHQFSGSAQMTHLCPRCTGELGDGVDACGNCKQKFISTKKTRLYAFTIPGGGYFYLKHYALGAFTALTEVALLALIGLYGYWVYLDVNNIIQILCLAGFIIALIILKFMAAYHCGLFTKEYIPID